uniref:Uncharacterized protein n=1 Tax=Cacopsylla melanoneura TaxID=428564 RepID=A0A8D8ZG44_9HEMI
MSSLQQHRLFGILHSRVSGRRRQHSRNAAPFIGIRARHSAQSLPNEASRATASVHDACPVRGRVRIWGLRDCLRCGLGHYVLFRLVGESVGQSGPGDDDTSNRTIRDTMQIHLYLWKGSPRLVRKQNILHQYRQ